MATTHVHDESTNMHHDVHDIHECDEHEHHARVHDIHVRRT